MDITYAEVRDICNKLAKLPPPEGTITLPAEVYELMLALADALEKDMPPEALR